MLYEITPEHEFYEPINNINKSGEMASNFTRQLLAFSRKQVLKMQSIDMLEIFNNLSKILIRLLGEDVAFELHANKIGNVWADPSQMEQVLMNLALNARDAMPGGGKIIVRLSEEQIDSDAAKQLQPLEPGQFVKIRFEDNGSGMPPDVMENIFEPFFTTKQVGLGTGLGLATVYGIVSQHKGCIIVDSVVGKGSVFTIYLPVHKLEAVAKKEERVKKPLIGGDETILVTEDDPQVRNLSITILKSLGYRFLEAASGEEALSVSGNHSGDIDLLLTDVVMPGMNGKELEEHLVRKRPGLKVVFMSGYTDDIIGRHGVLEPGVNFINKPVTVSNLAGIIRKVLGQQETD